ncbi:MAG: extracellular solute-binding protein [Paracoccaceae bacterium]|nr:extracellular solute-binding protein [Paracoccaceae bacterium]
MRFIFSPIRLLFSGLISVAFLNNSAGAEPQHGIAMYGEPELPINYTALPYANPKAPKGGIIISGETGGFDSLNPLILKGKSPWQLRFIAHESLMGRNWDEPFSLYGLLAETIETADDRSWVEFTLRPEAQFSDGSPVTVEDVLWSYETLGTLGHPRYHGLWAKISKAEATGPRSVKFSFSEENPELALITGLRPIIKKAQWADKEFQNSTLKEIPISSAPYVVGEFEAGRYLTLERNVDYWGNDLAFRRGTNNFDKIRYDYFGDGAVLFEAFKSGELSMHREFNADAWERKYDFPAITSGVVKKSLVPHQRPSGMTGFVMNTRRPIFADWRVRQAMLLAFNFEFINDAMTGNLQSRITSYFSNSVLAMQPGPAIGEVKALLAPYAADLLPGTMEGYGLPVSDGSERNRKNIAAATELLEQAGWQIKDGQLQNASGTLFTFEVLLQQSKKDHKSIMEIYARALERLGIEVRVSVVDSAQYTDRTKSQDFDMTYFRRGLSLSPGNEQYLYWGKDAADQAGSRNLMGVKSAAVDAMIDALISADSRSDFLAATRALDRVLTSGRYVIPFYQWNISRIAHSKDLHYSDDLPIYGDWLGFLPDVWWYEEDRK